LQAASQACGRGGLASSSGSFLATFLAVDIAQDQAVIEIEVADSKTFCVWIILQ